MPKQRLKVFEGSVPHLLRKQVQCSNGVGFITVEDGVEDVTFEALLNLDEVGLQAIDALRNRQGVSVRGGLVVRVLSRKRRESIATPSSPSI